jgi:HK97 family phage major capsid protein/HK97 family phage prohead protease
MAKANNFCTRAVEFRAADASAESGGDGRTMEGYAAVFDTPTEINSWEGKFTEEIARGAFKKTLGERKPVLQFDHGHDARTGTIPIGAFQELREDDEGLYCQARLFDNPVVEPIRQAIEGGAITGMSFRFKVNRDEWRDNAGKLVRGEDLGRLLYEPGDRGPLKRTIKEVQLFEAGPVVFPAYDQTSVGVRSLSDEEREQLVADYVRTAVGEEAPTAELVAAGFEPTAVVEAVRTDTIPDLLAPRVDKSTELPAPDAAREGTSETAGAPEDAARTGTSSGIERNSPPEGEPVRKVVRKAMNIFELRARLEEIDGRMSEVGDEYRDAEMPEDVESEWDGLKAERANVAASVKRIEERAAELKAAAVAKPATREAGSDRGAPAFHKKADNLYDLGALRSAAVSEDDFRDKLRDNAMRIVEGARFSSVARKSSAQEQVEHLLDNVDDDNGTLARRLHLTGSPLYERAFGKAMKSMNLHGLSAEEQRAMSLGTDSAGGYAVPFQLDPSVILTNAGAYSPVREMARVVQIVGKEWQGVTSAGITVSRDAEASEVSDDSPTLAQPVVRPTDVRGFVPFSIEIDMDWNAFRSEVTTMLVDAKAREEAAAFVTGNGTPPNASGVVSTLSGNTVTAGGTAAFAAADVYALEQALDVRWRTGNAQFLGNHTIYNKVRQFATTDGNALWERIGAGQPSQLLGYNAREASAMSAALTTGQKILLFGDFSQFLIVDRVGMSVELVPHLFHTANNLPTGQRGIFAIWRNSSKILVDAAFKLLVTG